MTEGIDQAFSFDFEVIASSGKAIKMKFYMDVVFESLASRLRCLSTLLDAYQRYSPIGLTQIPLGIGRLDDRASP